MHVSVLPGHVGDGIQLWLGLGLQQHLLVFGLLLHAAVRLALAQTLGVGRVQLLDAVAAALQPAGGRLLHHPGLAGRGERQHVQEHPGETKDGKKVWESVVYLSGFQIGGARVAGGPTGVVGGPQKVEGKMRGQKELKKEIQ